jgi:hypothetical protein
MKIWDRLYCYGYSIQAHWDALIHMLRGHDLRWFGDCVSLWDGHLGCIICDKCPDTGVEDGEHVGLIIWMRHSDALHWFGMRLCGLIGHPLFQHPKSGDTYKEDEIYCYRCMTDSKLRKVWLEDDPTATETRQD